MIGFSKVTLIIEGLNGDLNRLPEPLGEAFDSGVGNWSATTSGQYVVSGFVEGNIVFGVAHLGDGISVRLTSGDTGIQSKSLAGFESKTEEITGTFRALEAFLPVPEEEPDDPEPLRLAKLGYQVFPLASGSKKPDGNVCPNGFHQATSDARQLEVWLRDNPGCNWGMRAHHLVVDVDSYALKLESLPDWPDDPDCGADLANAGAVAITRNGGRHYHYAIPSDKSWSISAGVIADHVDIRAGGNGYVVIPPSRIEASPSSPGDGTYRWVEGCELTVSPDKLPAPPAWLVELLDNASSNRKSGGASIATVEERAQQEPIADKGVRTWVNTSPKYWQRVLDLLVECGATILHTKRDGTVYLCRPGKKPKDGNSATWDAPKSRDSKLNFPRLYVFSSGWPPFDANSGYSAWDVLTTLDPCATEAQLNTDYDQWIADNLPIATLPETATPTSKSLVAESVATVETIPFPEEVLKSFRKGGILDLFVQEVSEREYKRQPIVRAAFSLSLLSAAIGRKVRLKCGNMSNFYSLITLPSGEGKDAARKFANLLINATNPDSIDTDTAASKSLITNWPHSGSALMSLLVHNPERWILVDEVGGFLQSGKQNQNGNTGQLLTYLTTLFTHCTGPFVGQAYADPKRNGKVVDTPWVSLLGITAPRKLVDCLSRESLEDGLLPRMLWFPGDEFPELCCPDPGKDMEEVPADLANQIRKWRLPRSTVGVWSLDAEADNYLQEQRAGWEREKREHYSSGATEATLYTRCAEIAKRVSIVLAADQLETPKQNHVITRGIVDVACKLVNWSIQNFVQLCKDSLADSDVGRAENVILAFLRKTPANSWLNLEEIRRGCRRRVLDDARTRNYILEDLTKRSLIERQDVKVNGRPHNRYRLYRG
jgi:hypothetical protein